jgi:hypothetical protein
LSSGGSWDSVNKTLTLNHTSGSSIKIQTDALFNQSDTIQTIQCSSYPDDGGAQTIIILGPTDGKVINVGDATDDIRQVSFSIDGTETTEVYYSIQGEIDTIDATKMRWPRENEAGIMTIRRSGDSLFITYVVYDRVGS